MCIISFVLIFRVKLINFMMPILELRCTLLSLRWHLGKGGGGGLENVALYQDNQSTNQSINQSMAILYFVTF